MEINRARLLAYVNGDRSAYEVRYEATIAGMGGDFTLSDRTVNEALLRHDIHVLLHRTRTEDDVQSSTISMSSR